MKGYLKNLAGVGSPYFASIEMKKKGTSVNVAYECPCQKQKKVLHHPDYAKPHLVVKLYRSCHYREHRRIGKDPRYPNGMNVWKDAIAKALNIPEKDLVE